MKRNLFFVLIAITLVISAEACTAKTSSTISTNALSSTTVSSTTSGKTLNNPPQVIEPASQYEFRDGKTIITISPLIPLKVISITSPVLPGDTVTMVVQTAPNVYCYPSVTTVAAANPYGPGYTLASPDVSVTNPAPVPSGGGSALPGIAKSDASGRVIVVFKVDTDSLPGYCRVNVTVATFNPPYGINDSNASTSKESTVLTSFLVY